MTASSARWCAREGSRGGDGVQGERGEVQGARGSAWHSQARRGSGGKQEVAGARGRARRARARPPGREEDDRGGPDGLGRIGAGPAGLPGERQVRFLSSLLFLFLLFFLILFCVVLV